MPTTKDYRYDTTLNEEGVWKGIQVLGKTDDELRAAFSLEGEERADTKDELGARAKAMRRHIRTAEAAARKMDIVASLL